MRSFIPIASVLLALIAAGSIAYIAWELMKEAGREDDPTNPD